MGIPAQTGRDGKDHLIPTSRGWVLVPWVMLDTWSIPQCSPGNSGVLGVLTNPYTASSMLEPQPALPKVLATRNGIYLPGARCPSRWHHCVRKGMGGCRGTVPCQLSCCHWGRENHVPLPRGLQVWGGEEEPKMPPSMGRGGHVPILCFAGHLEPCWPWLAWGPF